MWTGLCQKTDSCDTHCTVLRTPAVTAVSAERHRQLTGEASGLRHCCSNTDLHKFIYLHPIKEPTDCHKREPFARATTMMSVLPSTISMTRQYGPATIVALLRWCYSVISAENTAWIFHNFRKFTECLAEALKQPTTKPRFKNSESRAIVNVLSPSLEHTASWPKEKCSIKKLYNICGVGLGEVGDERTSKYVPEPKGSQQNIALKQVHQHVQSNYQ